MTDLGPAFERLPEALHAPLRGVLADDETVLDIAVGVGATLVLTPHRLIMVRDGAAFRPRSGVRTWQLADGPGIRSSTLQHGTGRLLIEGLGRPASVFISEAQWATARRLVEGVHRRIYLLTKPKTHREDGTNGPAAVPD